ncbi:MAG TPA: 3-hydroxybutyryl-CoA dehydratase [candidate division Zixibacteria bacterium]|nr:3-hydroxybutyryl-CoA dehydratase [candidate division Zixibacteria bacterium]
MEPLIAVDLKRLVDNVKSAGQSRRVIWQDSETIAFLSRGRKERRDFHVDPSDEVTLQLSGIQRLVYLSAEGRQETATIEAGQMLLCPAGVPHSPRVEGDSWFIVFERKRKPGERDSFIWFCDRCGNKIYEVAVEVGDYRLDPVSTVHRTFYGDERLRTCGSCGYVVPVPPA